LLVGTTSGSYKIDTGEDLLDTTTTDAKYLQRIGNTIQAKRKIPESLTDRAIFKLLTGAASVNTRGAWEITVVANGIRTGSSSDRQRIVKWLVSRNSSGVFSTTEVSAVGTASAALTLNSVSDGLEIVIVGSSALGISAGGAWIEIKGMCGPRAGSGFSEAGWELLLPTL